MSTKFLAPTLTYRSCSMSKMASTIGSNSSEDVPPQSLMPREMTAIRFISSTISHGFAYGGGVQYTVFSPLRAESGEVFLKCENWLDRSSSAVAPGNAKL